MDSPDHPQREDQSLGRFDDEQEAARAYDTAARRLRPTGEAHGVISSKHWLKLNFPTAEEEAFAARRSPGAPNPMAMFTVCSPGWDAKCQQVCPLSAGARTHHRLGVFWQKFGYDGPPYCSRCSSVIRAHIVTRTVSNDKKVFPGGALQPLRENLVTVPHHKDRSVRINGQLRREEAGSREGRGGSHRHTHLPTLRKCTRNPHSHYMYDLLTRAPMFPRDCLCSYRPTLS